MFRLPFVAVLFLFMIAPALAMSKAQEFAAIDPSITPTKLVGNPDKYAGKYVKLHCTVMNVNQVQSMAMANVMCGQDQSTAIEMYGSRSSVGRWDAGDQINVIGWVKGGVDDAVSGSGGQVHFALVRFDYSL